MSDICSTTKGMEELHMKIKTAAENRKDVVKAMEEITGSSAKYMGPPTFAYTVGDFTVDRDGCVGHESEETLVDIQAQLAERGLAGEKADTLAVSIPIAGHTADSIKNLVFMIHSKQYLLEKALGSRAVAVSDKLSEQFEKEETADRETVIGMIGGEEAAGISFADGKITFTIPMPGDGETEAYTELFAKMAQAAKEHRRVSPKETIEENEKYYMRAWLVRIGLGGREYKNERSILLNNLKGHTAFRTEADRQKWQENRKKQTVESRHNA